MAAHPLTKSCASVMRLNLLVGMAFSLVLPARILPTALHLRDPRSSLRLAQAILASRASSVVGNLAGPQLPRPAATHIWPCVKGNLNVTEGGAKAAGPRYPSL
jgi:hypothetical protein